MASDPELDRKSLAVARTLGGIAFDTSHVMELAVFPLQMRVTLKEMGFPKCAHPNPIVRPTLESPPISDYMQMDTVSLPKMVEDRTYECLFCGARNEGSGWSDGSMNYPIQWHYLPADLNPINALKFYKDIVDEHPSNGPDRPDLT